MNEPEWFWINNVAEPQAVQSSLEQGVVLRSGNGPLGLNVGRESSRRQRGDSGRQAAAAAGATERHL